MRIVLSLLEGTAKKAARVAKPARTLVRDAHTRFRMTVRVSLEDGRRE